MSLNDQFRSLGGAVMAKCAICEKGAHFGVEIKCEVRQSKDRRRLQENVRLYILLKIRPCRTCVNSSDMQRKNEETIQVYLKSALYFFLYRADARQRDEAQRNRAACLNGHRQSYYRVSASLLVSALYFFLYRADARQRDEAQRNRAACLNGHRRSR